MGITEPLFSQQFFEGGLNRNPKIAENELQEATNVDVEEDGVLKPALDDTLIKSVANVICHQVIDGFIYYLVGTTLSRCTTAGANTVALGTIGADYFIAENWHGVHIIIATDKVYEVIGGVLYDLGVTTPTDTPTTAFVGAGALTGTYQMSYSYVKKFTLADGSAYEEESPLSPEVEASPVAQDIVVNGMTDSAESGVTHKRIYIRGGNLTTRVEAGEIAQGVTTFTIDDAEDVLVTNTVEDVDNNDKAPTPPVHGRIVDGILFLVVGKNVYWSRSLIPSAFPTLNFSTFSYPPKAVAPIGSNLAVLMQSQEVIYVNPGFTAAQGGYLHEPFNQQGCISIRSSTKGYYASNEGMAFLRSSEPEIFTHKIRSELLALSDRSDTVGAYLRGRYYFCIPSESVMYEYQSSTGRFLKYDNITDVTAGDDGVLYVVKAAGIHSFGTSTTKKAFAYRTPEVILPEDGRFERFTIDADFGDDAVTAEYYVNDAVLTTKTFTSSGRESQPFPIDQKAGSRISLRLSRATTTTNANDSIHGVHLR